MALLKGKETLAKFGFEAEGPIEIPYLGKAYLMAIVIDHEGWQARFRGYGALAHLAGPVEKEENVGNPMYIGGLGPGGGVFTAGNTQGYASGFVMHQAFCPECTGMQTKLNAALAKIESLEAELAVAYEKPEPPADTERYLEFD